VSKGLFMRHHVFVSCPVTLGEDRSLFHQAPSSRGAPGHATRWRDTYGTICATLWSWHEGLWWHMPGDVNMFAFTLSWLQG